MKEESNMEIKKNTIINDSDLEQVKGGSSASIFYFIEIGDEFRARRFLRMKYTP